VLRQRKTEKRTGKRLTVKIVLENDEPGVDLVGFGDDLVESGEGRLSGGGSSSDLPVVGVELDSVGTGPDDGCSGQQAERLKSQLRVTTVILEIRLKKEKSTNQSGPWPQR
jgi:hypothetical protein